MFGVNLFVNFTNVFVPSQTWSTNLCRTYVRAFWAKNNDSPYIYGHTRNEPFLRKYVRGKRNIQHEWIYRKPNEFKRMRRHGWEHKFATPEGRLKIMKKYLEKSPYLTETI